MRIKLRKFYNEGGYCAWEIEFPELSNKEEEALIKAYKRMSRDYAAIRNWAKWDDTNTIEVVLSTYEDIDVETAREIATQIKDLAEKIMYENYEEMIE